MLVNIFYKKYGMFLIFLVVFVIRCYRNSFFRYFEKFKQTLTKRWFWKRVQIMDSKNGSKNGWKKMFTITSAASTIFTRTPFYRVSGFFHSFRFDVLIRFPIHCARKCRFNLKKCWSFSNKSSRDGPRVEVGGRDIFVKEKIEDDSNTHQKKNYSVEPILQKNS